MAVFRGMPQNQKGQQHKTLLFNWAYRRRGSLAVARRWYSSKGEYIPAHVAARGLRIRLFVWPLKNPHRSVCSSSAYKPLNPFASPYQTPRFVHSILALLHPQLPSIEAPYLTARAAIMSGFSGEPWSNNPNAPRISSWMHTAEQELLAGAAIGNILYGTSIDESLRVHSPCLFDVLFQELS